MNRRSQHAERSRRGSGPRNDDAPALRLTHHLASQISRRFARLIYLVYTIQSCTMFHESLEEPLLIQEILTLDTIAGATNYPTEKEKKRGTSLPLE